MVRLLVVLALYLTACDESDPSTSEHCVEIRMRYIEAKYHRDQVRTAEEALGSAPDRSLDLALAKLQNENWACFK